MSDMIDDFRALKEWRKERKARLGAKCPMCVKVRPRAHDTAERIRGMIRALIPEAGERETEDKP
jgi:hypothetical protein